MVVKFLLAVALAALSFAQDAESKPAALAPPESRSIPANSGEVRKLVESMEAYRAELIAAQRDDSNASRARTIEILENGIETLKRLDARRGETTVEVARASRARREIDELRKRLAQIERDDEPLPSAADRDAEAVLARHREAVDELIREQMQRRDEAGTVREKQKLEQERAQRRLPIAKRDLNEAQSDWRASEDDVRAASEGGLAGDEVRAMAEQAWLYRARVAEYGASVALLELQAGEVTEAVTEQAAAEALLADEMLRRLEARRARIDALAERAAASRLDRGHAERAAIGATLEHVADWAKPYWSLKHRLAGIQVHLADLAARRRAIETRSCCGGDLAILRDEAAEEAKTLDRLDARNERVEEYLPGGVTTRGLQDLIAQREDGLVALERAQEQLRGLRKDFRDLQHLVRTEDTSFVTRGIAHLRQAPPAGEALADPAEREAASPSAWDALGAGLRSAAGERLASMEAYDQVLTEAQYAISDTRQTIERNLLRYRNALLWTRDPSEISMESIREARADLVEMPRTVARGVREALLGSWQWVVEAARAGRVANLVLVFGSLAALIAAVFFIHRRASKGFTQVALPDMTLNEAAKVGATVIRKVEWSGIIAFAGVVLPLLAGASRNVVLVCAATFTPVFFYRLGVALIDFLFGPAGSSGGALTVPEGVARIARRALTLVLRISACTVPVAVLLTVTGYRDKNPGCVELLWLVHSIACYLVVLVVLLRPSGLPSLLFRRGGASEGAPAIRATLATVYPFVIAAVVFLLVLRSLSYRVAVQHFLERFLITTGWIAAAFLARRWLLRLLFGGAPKVPPPAHELASDRERYEAEGRRALSDRLRRTGVVLVTFVPAVFFVLDAWSLTGAGWDALAAKKLTFISEGLTVGALVSAVITTIVAVIAGRAIRDLLRFVILPNTSLDVGVRYTIVTLTTYALIAISALIVLGGQLRLSPAVIGGFIAALGLGLGFGLQEIINNFFSGLILLVERPVKVGDTVTIAGTTGRVDRINMRSTMIVTGENTGVIIPNKALISSTVTNWSAASTTLREAIKLSIAFGSDTGLFKKIVLDAVESHGLVLKRPGPDVSFVGFGPHSLDFVVRYSIRMSTSGGRVKSDLLHALDAAFRKNGIEIPYPQQGVTIRRESVPDEAPRAAAED